MPDRAIDSKSAPNEVELWIEIDADLLEQIKYLTSDLNKVVEVAVRQWLGSGDRQGDDLIPTTHRNPPVPPRGAWRDYMEGRDDDLTQIMRRNPPVPAKSYWDEIRKEEQQIEKNLPLKKSPKEKGHAVDAQTSTETHRIEAELLNDLQVLDKLDARIEEIQKKTKQLRKDARKSLSALAEVVEEL